MSDITTPDKLSEIRRLNDTFRTTFRGGQILLTQSVTNLPEMVKASAIRMVAEFKDWTPEIDPNGEHDYLSFDLCYQEFMFKIDYYDLTMEHASPDPADPRVTKRVGTLMLSVDW